MASCWAGRAREWLSSVLVCCECGVEYDHCVSLLLSFGVNPRVVMGIVGHSAMEMTMNVYGHVTLDNQRAALDLLNDRIVGAGEGGE